MRAFLRDGRLVSIPAKPSKRDLLLPVILDRCFPEDRDYEEKEVNMRLALLHPDVAALRRYLVDGGLDDPRRRDLPARRSPPDEPLAAGAAAATPAVGSVAAVRPVAAASAALRVLAADDRLDQPESPSWRR